MTAPLGAHERRAIVGPATLLGVGLLGIGWILLGIDVAFRRTPGHPEHVEPVPSSAGRPEG